MAEVEIRLGRVMAGGGDLLFSAEIDGSGRVWAVICAVSSEGARVVVTRMPIAGLDSIEAKFRDIRVAADKLSRLAR